MVKGPALSKTENLYFLAFVQTKLMQPNLMSCKAPFRSNLKKKNIGPVVFCKLLLNGASDDTKIDCIRLVGRELKNIN